MNNGHRLLVGIGFAVMIVALTGFSRPGLAADEPRSLPQADASLYAETPPVMLPAECGRCHRSQFVSLQEFGGKHRFACQGCHEVFHAYNPRKGNFDELMPKCTACHGKLHGPVQTECLNCHQNPHAPQQLPGMELLANVCADCHSGPGQELKMFPSAHTEQGCQTCHHDTHGYIPNCSECHDGHYAGQPMKECSSCHYQVHAPLHIIFPGDVNLKTCGGCHDDVYGKWLNTPSKHGQVACVSCHQQHGKVPDCLDCHEVPHNKKQLEMFPNCLTCHLDVHDLPVKK
jgi:hypothetical protein